jgi:hypothetical protein
MTQHLLAQLCFTASGIGAAGLLLVAVVDRIRDR